jgi:hypothetical protein
MVRVQTRGGEAADPLKKKKQYGTMDDAGWTGIPKKNVSTCFSLPGGERTKHLITPCINTT